MSIQSRSFDLDDAKKFKIVIIGDAAAGKTCLLTRYLEDIFLENSRPTPGVNVKKKEEIITISNKRGKQDHGRHHSRQFEYWDLGGQRLFEQIRTMYMKGSDGIILCFNLNDERSFISTTGEDDHSIGKFIKEMIDAFGKDQVKDIPVLLVGTKNDLTIKVESRHVVSVIRKLRKAGMNIISYEKNPGSDMFVFGKHHLKFNRMWEAEKWRTGSGWIPTSSKLGNGVQDVFEIMRIVLFEASTFLSEEIKQKTVPRVSLSGIRAVTGQRSRYKSSYNRRDSNSTSTKGYEKSENSQKSRSKKRNRERVW
ncbi:MAG: Rab family GTPase [Candidatus Hodarchaeales archaeon]|jgi:small GTP-binding protein